MDEFKAERDPVLRRAGEWLLELQSPDVPVERIAEWQQWLAASAQHRRAYQELQATWQRVERIPAPTWPNDTEVRADRHKPWQSISEWRAQRREIRPSRRWAAGLATAATITLTALGVHVWQSFGKPLVIQTPTGQNREVQLADGSSVSVGAGSLLRVAMRKAERNVVLERGEAYFNVAKDAARPFRVRAGNVAITAIGTAFNVRRTGAHVVVAVSEGAVDVDRTRLSVGQKLVLEPQGVASKIERVALQTVASWRNGRLQFSGEPLYVVIEDVNRYAERPILIADPTIRQLRVTGSTSEKNIDGWLHSLEKALPIDIVVQPDGSKTLVSAK